MNNPKYKYAILGGTFDRFHRGHRQLIETACEQSEKVTIGLATEKLYQNKLLAEFIEEYSTRQEKLENFAVPVGAW